MLRLLTIVICLTSGLSLAAPIAPPKSSGEMRVYPTKYYIIHTDIRTDDAKEAVIRMTKMAEEYHDRTREFSGEIRARLPFYLFKDRDEYYEAGGLPGSAGVFTGSALLAIAGDQTSGRTWHVVQHEGFHQFADAVIRGELPTWLNEGLAEYFGESLFTGDGFVSGVIPPSRMKRIQQQVRDNQFKSIQQIMTLSHAEWNRVMTLANYDQAWSMVHFLAHGEGGRYQQPFVNFMKLIGRGTPWPNAWAQTFGSAAGFEQRWKEYWLNLPQDPTKDLYAQAVTATFTSFLARAQTQKQQFSSFDEFLSAAKAGEVKTGQTIDDWLPPGLLQGAVDALKDSKLHWTLESKGKEPLLAVDLPDGTRLVGSYFLRGGHVGRVWIEIDDSLASIKQAESLIASGKRDQARALLQRMLRAHPRSPAAEQARKLIAQTK